MSAVLFAPHNDDETLFAFFQLLKHKPHVYVVLRSYRQWIEQSGPNYERREAETACAMGIAGCEWTQWEMPDNEASWRNVAISIQQTLREQEPAIVIAPAWEMGGHEDHNAVASIVAGIEGPWTLVRYLTYQRGQERTLSTTQIDGDQEEAGLKMQALLCYESQINHPATADWFPGGRYHRLSEWLAP